jgi:hypothetical protein
MNDTLSKLMEEACNSNQNAVDAISSCQNELKSMFLEGKQKNSGNDPLQLDFIITLVGVFNDQRITRTKRYVYITYPTIDKITILTKCSSISNREATPYTLDLGDLQDGLYDYVTCNCHELKQLITTFLDVQSTTEENDQQQFVNTSKRVIAFSPVLALSHQLLRQHHMQTNFKGKYNVEQFGVPLKRIVNNIIYHRWPL